MKVPVIRGKIFNRFRSFINVKRFSKTWMGKHLTMIQLTELDACMHCRTCSSQCSVAVAFEGIPNNNILPSEKLASIRALVSGKELTLRRVQEYSGGSLPLYPLLPLHSGLSSGDRSTEFLD